MVRDFLADAWVAVFYHSAASAIYVDSCKRHIPSAYLAQILSESTGYPVPEDGWTGYTITGDVGDYLTGEGVASVTIELTDHDEPEFERNLAGVRAMLSAAQDVVAAEAYALNADYTWLQTSEESNTGVIRYQEDTFAHPLALVLLDATALVLDGGRVLSLGLEPPTAPEILLSPGDQVGGVRVLEPLDLATDGESLFILDRAGDVYRYQPSTGEWLVDRYDRPPRDTYDHYYVAMAADGLDDTRYLLETSHEVVWGYRSGEEGRSVAQLAKSRDVDLDVHQDELFVLTRSTNSPIGTLSKFGSSGQRAAGFQPNIGIMHPRRVAISDQTLYVLDRGGRRLLRIDPDTGVLAGIHQFTDRQSVSTIWVDPAGKQVVLAGQDTLYFYGEPRRTAKVEGGPQLTEPVPHDPELLEMLRGLAMPIERATITGRDFQMPGAPRHYRLGVHEGLDFYGYMVGVPVELGTEVRAVKGGTVVRATVDYEPLTAAKAEAWANESLTKGYTPDNVLDGYRGRQVWIDHGGGIVSRYAHLSAIAPGITEGVRVEQGQVIAAVGNSGTPASVGSQTSDAHLHFELWVGDHFVGQFLRPIEAREWWERILR
jgi:murein DD-endopeptidase MepM/ murein hydrolase activator NlpD